MTPVTRIMEPTQFSVGKAIFSTPRLAEIQAREGDLAAWREAFSTSGMDAPNQVRGDYAVAVQCRDGKVFLAVDRFSVRSLCYRVDGEAIHVAERADVAAGDAADIDPQAIFDYFYFHVIPSPRTIFKDVYRLPAGHCARIEHGQVTVAPYWQPEFHEGRARQSFAALKDEFLQLLETAVRDQVGDEAIGCYLSGGTDSSTVAGLLTRVTGKPADAFSIGFDAQGYDEMAYARIAAKRFGVNHHEYYVTPDDLTRSIPDVAAHYDQPFGNSSALPGYYCARAAHAQGIRKLLAGDGGDELFGGNSRYAKQKVFHWYGVFPEPVRKNLMEPLAPLFKDIPLLKKGASYVEQAQIPMPARMYSYSLLTRLGVDKIFPPAMLAAFDQDAPLRHQQQVWDEPRATDLVNRMLAFDWRYTLAENDLPKVCGTAGLAGVSVGFPLLDQRIADFSMTLPPAYKVKGLKLRWFFKEALRGFLPDEIITKKKHGFGLPFGVWASRHPGLLALSQDSLHGLAARGVVRPEFIQTLFKDLLPLHPGYYGEMVWIMMMLENWFRRHAPGFKGA